MPATISIRHNLRRLYAAVQAAMPGARAREAIVMERRKRVVPQLDVLSRRADLGPAGRPTFQRILIDGMWDNPNYWTRYALIRAALGLWQGEETGLLGPFNKRRVRNSFAMFGVGNVVDFEHESGPIHRFEAQAHAMLAGVYRPEDILALRLPEDFPAEIFYDGLLKRQRRGAADPTDPMLVHYLSEALANLAAARRIIDGGRFDLVLLSHAVNYDFSALAWCAIRSGIPVIVLYGGFGSARFIRIGRPQDLFYYVNSPTNDELNRAPAGFRDRQRAAGAAYLERRLQGGSNDVGAVYAYQKRTEHVDRQSAAAQLGWDPHTPIICVYGANWFDFPHSIRMVNFRDFQDWIEATLAVARQTPSVNWLFKAHPCDDWYPSSRGPTLMELVGAAPAPNVAVVPKGWNGFSLMRAIDAGITYFGTIGIELPSIGTPVMVADEGWYGSKGFVHCPGDRAAYLAALKTRWWERQDSAAISARAKEFAGWYFAGPSWHGSYEFRDDADQEAIYDDLPAFLNRFAAQIDQEVPLIRAWVESDHRFHHVYKMLAEASTTDARAHAAAQ